MSGITLTATQRASLLSLGQASELSQTTQGQLNTGNKVNSATDNAVAFFQAQSLSSSATSLTNQKNTIDQNIQTLGTAQSATSAVEGLLVQLKGVLDSARGASVQQRTAATQQFTDIGDQLAQVVKDASYQGANLLSGTTKSLVTPLSADGTSTLTVTGYNLINSTGGNAQSLFTQANAVFNAASQFVFSATVGNAGIDNGTSSLAAITGFSALDVTAGAGSAIAGSSAQAVFAATDARLNNAINQLQGITASLGTNATILQTRASFTTGYTTTASTGSNKLTLADLNVEAANSQALTLRQQIGVQSLSISGQQNQSILSLLR